SSSPWTSTRSAACCAATTRGGEARRRRPVGLRDLREALGVGLGEFFEGTQGDAGLIVRLLQRRESTAPGLLLTSRPWDREGPAGTSSPSSSRSEPFLVTLGALPRHARA